MKKDINQFIHNAESDRTYLKYLPVFTTQDFKSMFDHFSYITKERDKL